MAQETSLRQYARMESDTRQLLSELREDHRNMAMVLNVLEGAVETAATGEDPDFELIDEIMRYMTIYPDAVHHPKEDVVYAELKEQRPDLAEGLDDVPEDHAQIATLGSKLRDDVEAIIAGAAVRREQFIRDALIYVGRLRNHMRWEEEDLFNRIDTMIGEDSHAVELGDFLHIKDPVFELEVEAGFRRLMSSLKSG
jgi:hemerythrin-like domain-containing protein